MKQLFSEFNTKDPTYTLADKDQCKIPSLYRLYMEMEDLTEFDFANKYFNGLSHWKTLCSLSWFQPYVIRWREELQEKIRSRSLKILIEESTKDGPSKVSINKYLVEKGYLSNPPPSPKGRPLKDRSIPPSLELQQSNDTSEDLRRLEALRKGKEALQ